MNEVGYVLWHSLNESGNVEIYDVEWPDGTIERNIPAILLEKVKDSNDDVDEADLSDPHEAHGVEGYEKNALVSEREYKKRKSRKKKKKKIRKRKPNYWYIGGYGIHHDHDFADFGGDFGGDGGGGE